MASASFYYGVRLAALLPDGTVDRILDGMWRRLEREHGPGTRGDHSEASASDGAFVEHVVTWTPT